ncbi:MAG: nuclear transport factor 2 family protein [Calditrichota bacterium]
MKTLVIYSIALFFIASCNNQQVKVEEEAMLSNKEKAVALLESIETGDPTPASYINPNKYIQHNLMVGDGIAGFAEVMKQIPKGSAKAKVVRAFQDGDYVFTHTEYDFFGPKVGFDIFRFENGLIVEHWDNLQPIAEKNVSGRTQLDGPTEVTNLNETEANKALIKGFVADVLMGENPAKITDYVSTETYHQHNPNVGDGLAALGQAIQAMAEAGTPMVYTKNHMLLGEGNFVLTASEGQFMGKHVAYYDLFRIADGKIVEHWDAIEDIPAKETWKHNNGKF